MSTQEWWIALLLPPAVFGLAAAIEVYRTMARNHRARAQQRRWDLDVNRALRQAQERHPSARPVGPEDRPDWGTRG